MTTFPQNLEQITTIILDVDGVLTNGEVILSSSGEQIRTMNIKDGYALQFAVKSGFRVAIISGGKSEMVRKRLQGLGIHDIYLGAADKMDAFDELKITYDLSNEEIAYMGDDIPDYPVMNEVALASCPKDAANEIKEIAHFISSFEGGKGAVRELIEKIMRAQNKWFNQGEKTNAQLW